MSYVVSGFRNTLNPRYDTRLNFLSSNLILYTLNLAFYNETLAPKEMGQVEAETRCCIFANVGRLKGGEGKRSENILSLGKNRTRSDRLKGDARSAGAIYIRKRGVSDLVYIEVTCE